MGPSGSLPSINQIGPPVINILIREQPFHHPTPLLVHCPRRGRIVPFTEPSIIIGHRDVEVTPPDGRSTCVIGVLADESLSCWESGSRLLWPSPLWTAYLSSMTFGEPGERLSRSKASEMCTCILLLPPHQHVYGCKCEEAKTENMYLLLETRFIHPDFNDLCSFPELSLCN